MNFSISVIPNIYWAFFYQFVKLDFFYFLILVVISRGRLSNGVQPVLRIRIRSKSSGSATLGGKNGSSLVDFLRHLLRLPLKNFNNQFLPLFSLHFAVLYPSVKKVKINFTAMANRGGPFHVRYMAGRRGITLSTYPLPPPPQKKYIYTLSSFLNRSLSYA
jgi:hypothetical protein